MALSLLLSGCSLDAAIQSLSEIPKVFSKAATTEITPASSQHSYTTRGYKIQASVSYQDASSEAVTARGFKVYTNVQGTIFKE